MFIVTVVEFLHKNHWLKESDITEECKSWFSMLFQLIIFEDDECLKCVDIVVDSITQNLFGTFCITEVCSCMQLFNLE